MARMTKEEFAQAKAEINSHPLSDFYDLEPSPKAGPNMYCCPDCQSGHGPHRTGTLTLYDNGDKWTVFCAKGCFGVGRHQAMTTLDALCKLWNTNALGVMDRLGYTKGTPARASSSGKERAPATTEKPKPTPAPPPTEDYSAKYDEWHKKLIESPEAMEYLHGRGFTRDTIDRFNLGFCPNWNHPKNKSFRTDRIIIPMTATSYRAHRMDGESDRKYQPVGPDNVLMNEGAIDGAMMESGQPYPIVVVEGTLDVCAIWQAGYSYTVGLNGLGHINDFISIAKKRNPGAVYVLALDNDPEDTDPKKDRQGQKGQEKLAGLMEAEGLDYISADTAQLYGGKKDANEAMLTDADGLLGRLTDWLSDAMIKYQERRAREEAETYYRSGPGMVDTFLAEVRGGRYRPLPTGIRAIDEAIGGGLFRQTVVILGAAPGMGKTALASQIAESIAKAGTADVLYINLEMSREQLLARSLARIAYNNGYKSISTTEILQGYRWTIDTEEAVHEAADEYKATIAQHLIYNPGEDATDLDRIMEKIENEKKRLGHAPIVCLDYLQLVTGQSNGRDEDNVATIKRTMQRLKQYAIQEDTIAFIITANNRASMATGDSDLNSGRDTSNIEYGSDLHLGLVYTAVATGEKTKKEIEQMRDAYWDDRSNPTAAADYEQYCTGYTLKVNKNRHGAAGRKALLKFNGDCAMFTPIDTIHTEPDYTR